MHQSKDFLKNKLFLEFEKALCDDLNTPMALGILGKMVNSLNISSSNETKELYLSINQALEILGLKNDLSFQKESSDHFINSLIMEREIARKEKKYDRADEIRNILRKENIEIEDTLEGTRWIKLK